MNQNANPHPKPDRIEPASPPEYPVTPSPTEDPAHQPLEVPGSPGGDEDNPGRGPSEIPSQPSQPPQREI